MNVDRWQRDPFGGELVDDEHGRAQVWGRGAVDMLNLTASMAVATKRLAASGFRPRGTLIYLAVADEEALGTYGAAHLVERERDAVTADYVITESGGIPIPSPDGLKLPVIVGEKGHVVVHPAGEGHGGTRVPAVPHRQRTRHRGRSRRRIAAFSRRRCCTTCGAGSSSRSAIRRNSPLPCSKRRDSSRCVRPCRSEWPGSSTPALTRRSRRRSSTVARRPT